MAFRVAVLGSGGWSQVHLAALSKSDHVSGVVLAGRNAARLLEISARFPIVEATTDVRTAIEDERIDVVIVVLPHHLHGETTLAALAAGKHVICEKPAALTLAQFDRAAAAAIAHNRRLLIVMNQLYNPVNQRVRKLLDEGDLGRPFLLVETAFSRHAHHYHDPATWRTRVAEAGGGVLIDGGYHMVYKHLEWLAAWGPPRWVIGDAAQLAVNANGHHQVEQGEDYVCYSIGFDAPLRIASAHAWTLAEEARQPRQNFVAGTDGTLELSGDLESPLVLHSAGASRCVDVPAGPTGNQETQEACLLDFLASLAEDRPPRHGSLAAARQTLEIILSVYESARSGRRVMLA